MNIQPLTGALGAEISDVDLSQHLSDNTAEQLRKAWLKYKVLVYRDQTLMLDQHTVAPSLPVDLVIEKF